VILPDLNAGCSMADMANVDQVEESWDEIAAITARVINELPPRKEPPKTLPPLRRLNRAS